MAFAYEDRQIDSRFVEVIWKTKDLTDGVYMAPADGSWDLIFITEAGKTRVLFSGPTSRATPVPYKAGNKNLGIRFKPGAFMTKIPAGNMLNKIDILPVHDNKTFELFGYTFPIPSYETADNLIAAFESLGFLDEDRIVSSSLKGKTYSMTSRSVQRHFAAATGLSKHYHERILQAQRAIDLIQSGTSLIEAAHMASYADQAHMTRALRQLSGLTPAEIATAEQPIIIEHLH